MASRGVVFWDFDGTLGFGPHGPGAWAPCLVEALDELHPGHNVTVDELRPFTRGRYPWSTPERSHTHIQTATEWWDELELVFRTAFEGVGFAETASALAKRAGRYYADGARWGLFDDTVPALEQLSGLGWRHVVFSNNIPELAENLDCLGVGELIESVVCSAAIGYEKPHPDAYRCALEVAGNPKSRWMVGDSFEADVAGARRAQIPAILVRRQHPDAQHSAPNLLDAAAIIGAHES
jgi:putative hydrolase of the HAD superfamily